MRQTFISYFIHLYSNERLKNRIIIFFINSLYINCFISYRIDISCFLLHRCRITSILKTRCDESIIQLLSSIRKKGAQCSNCILRVFKSKISPSIVLASSKQSLGRFIKFPKISIDFKVIIDCAKAHRNLRCLNFS